MFKDAKTVAGFIIVVTVCACILVPTIASLWHVGEVTETFRAKMFDMIYLLAGVGSGWLMGSGSTKDPPKV